MGMRTGNPRPLVDLAAALGFMKPMPTVDGLTSELVRYADLARA
jgi:hypothetical protein